MTDEYFSDWPVQVGSSCRGREVPRWCNPSFAPNSTFCPQTSCSWERRGEDKSSHQHMSDTHQEIAEVLGVQEEVSIRRLSPWASRTWRSLAVPSSTLPVSLKRAPSSRSRGNSDLLSHARTSSRLDQQKQEKLGGVNSLTFSSRTIRLIYWPDMINWYVVKPHTVCTWLKIKSLICGFSFTRMSPN